MELIELVKNEYISILFGGLGGILTAFVSQRFLNKRGVFSYFVRHNRAGISSQDPVFGDVSVTWNGNAVDHLYLSTVDLSNDSLNDYENVAIRASTNDTRLLSESSQILDTPKILHWTEDYKSQIFVEQGKEATDAQKNIYWGQREYLIPVFNRGDQVRITYLNSALTDNAPHIWLTATIKGVKVKFQTPQEQIYNVPRPRAAIVGISLGLVLLIPLVLLVTETWIVALVAITYGFIAQVPGAFTIRVYRKVRELVGG